MEKIKNIMNSLSLNIKIEKKNQKDLPLVDRVISFCFSVFFLSYNCPVLLLLMKKNLFCI